MKLKKSQWKKIDYKRGFKQTASDEIHSQLEEEMKENISQIIKISKRLKRGKSIDVDSLIRAIEIVNGDYLSI